MMLHDIELAVKRGRALSEESQSSPNGLELRLREITSAVSSKDGNQGLLDRVKRFNALLESAVAVL